MHTVVPKSFRKLVVTKLAPIFKETVDIVHQTLIRARPKEVLVKNKYVGINPADVNTAAHNRQNFPLDIGSEGIGEIVDVGDKVDDLKYGDPVMHLKFGAFSEYMYIPASEVIPVSNLTPKWMPFLIDGPTASLSLDKCGQIVPGEKVLITAAAGGAGHIAVQWAKNVGCHVIGTCSSAEEAKFLEDIGCHRPINCETESLEKILYEEYPKGIDVVWESEGGRMFGTLLKHLAVRGRLVVVGPISSHLTLHKDLMAKLIAQSSTISGFSLSHYAADIPHYMSLLVRQNHEQNLKAAIDDRRKFQGLEDVAEAVEFLQSGKNIGKVVVQL